MVSGMPRPIPAGVLVTYSARNIARGRGFISFKGIALPCVTATIFSVIKTISPSHILSFKYFKAISTILSSFLIKWVLIGIRINLSLSTLISSFFPMFVIIGWGWSMKRPPKIVNILL